MAGKQLTQAGLNKTIWNMLKRLGGKFQITEHELAVMSDDAIKIQHDPVTKTFYFSLCQAKEDEKSNILLPNGLN